MAQVTRLGLYGGARAPYAGFVAATATAAITGTATASITEADIVTGGKTLIITLTNDTWVASGATFNAIRQDIIDGLDAAASPALGWNDEVRDKEVVAAVVRDSDTQVTITLTASALYDITATETITITVPATAVTAAAPITATPTFSVVIAVVTSTTGGVRRHRFLRRGPRLPWEDKETEEKRDEPVVVAKSKRKRIKLPAEVKQAAAEAIPLETHITIDAPKIKLPGVGTAVLQVPDDEEEAVLLALLQ